MSFHVPNRYRVRSGVMGSDDSYGNCGCFLIPHPNSNSSLWLKVIASDGGDWEHVSVSLKARCPTWEEMCFIKSLYWDDEDCVMQLHPPRSQYVNNHPYCLHLWRPTGEHQIPQPPSIFVGIVA